MLFDAAKNRRTRSLGDPGLIDAACHLRISFFHLEPGHHEQGAEEVLEDLRAWCREDGGPVALGAVRAEVLSRPPAACQMCRASRCQDWALARELRKARFLGSLDGVVREKDSPPASSVFRSRPARGQEPCCFAQLCRSDARREKSPCCVPASFVWVLLPSHDSLLFLASVPQTVPLARTPHAANKRCQTLTSASTPS